MNLFDFIRQPIWPNLMGQSMLVFFLVLVVISFFKIYQLTKINQQLVKLKRYKNLRILNKTSGQQIFFILSSSLISIALCALGTSYTYLYINKTYYLYLLTPSVIGYFYAKILFRSEEK